MTADVPGPAAGAEALARCVGDVERFLRAHWGQRFHLHRQPAEAVAGLLSLDDVDAILTTTSPRTPAFRLVQGGRALPRSRYTRPGVVGGQRLDDLPDVGRVLELFRTGATIALQGLHRWWPPVAALCRDLEAFLTHPIQANAYVTPPGSRGLAVHHDTHDVLALQTAGRKHWVVHEPAIESPLATQRWRSDEHEPGALQLDTDLTPGDCLYLPRGTPHAAETTGEVSVHLTLGIRAVTWHTVLERAFRRAADEVAFRRELPVGFARDPEGLAAEVATTLKQAARWLESLDAATLADEVARERWTQRQPDLRGQLVAQLDPGAVDDDTVVRARASNAALLEERGERVAIVLGDRTVTLPAAAAPAVRELLGGDPVRVGDLADRLAPEGRRVLVRRLLREGLLVRDGDDG